MMYGSEDSSFSNVKVVSCVLESKFRDESGTLYVYFLRIFRLPIFRLIFRLRDLILQDHTQ